jgi:hypothetical protein
MPLDAATARAGLRRGWTRASRSVKEMLSKNALPSMALPSASFMIR